MTKAVVVENLRKTYGDVVAVVGAAGVPATERLSRGRRRPHEMRNVHLYVKWPFRPYPGLQSPPEERHG